MSGITLTASSRSALTSLTSTASLMSRTQNRLTTGLKVASAIDDAVSYFQAQALTDRSSDFTDRKTQMDQGISSVTAGLNGTTSITGVLKQMQGILDTARTADSTTRGTLAKEFNNLGTQINSLVADSSYQGLDLIDNSTANLTVYLSEGTTANLSMTAQNMNTSGALFSIGSQVASAGLASVFLSAGGSSWSGLVASNSSDIDTAQAWIKTAVSNSNALSAQLGGNVTFLQTRLDFTSNYVNTMTTGASKMTLADLNTEGANLVALQTRQQIGIQSLSIAGQQQQSILSLIR